MKIDSLRPSCYLGVTKKFALAVFLTNAFVAAAVAQTNTFPSSGNAGVGTTSPSGKLEVISGSGSSEPGVLGIYLGTTNTTFNSKASIGQNYDGLYLTNNAYHDSGGWHVFTTGKTTSKIVLSNYVSGVGSIDFATTNTNNTADPPIRMSINGSGNVGIGTTNPLAQLHFGTALNSGLKTYTASATDHGFLFNSYMDTNAPYRRYGDIVAMSNQDGISGGSTIRFLTNPHNSFTAVERMRIDYLGNIGIGTMTPSNLLHINSGSTPSSQFRLTANNTGSLSGLTYAPDNVAVGFDVDWSNGVGWIARHGTVAALYKLGGKLQMMGWSGATVGSPIPDWTTFTSLDLTTGRFGIGIANPSYKLDVQGGQINSSGGLCIAGDCKTTWSQVGSQWATSGSNISYSVGNVGIGVSSPLTYAALDINTSSSKSIHTMDSTYGGLLIGYQGSTIQARQTNDGNNQNLILQNWGGSVVIGNVTNPQNKLHVGGSITVDGNINAKYQDVAEWVPSSQQLSAGTVVILDTAKSNQVTSSLTAYDTRVAGVISIQPGIALGEKSEDKVLVATTGRVRVKVDASRVAINIGDLLVTSDIPGVAMKSEPVEFAGRKMHMPGTIIGKALEPLQKGQGEILVLLSLQ